MGVDANFATETFIALANISVLESIYYFTI